MRILFDHGPLSAFLTHHTVTLAKDVGWDRLANGELIRAAEIQGFDLLLTTDRRMRYQQNLRNRKIAIVVITGTTAWPSVSHHLDRLVATVDASAAGVYVEVFIPFE